MNQALHTLYIKSLLHSLAETSETLPSALQQRSTHDRRYLRPRRVYSSLAAGRVYHRSVF